MVRNLILGVLAFVGFLAFAWLSLDVLWPAFIRWSLG